MITVKKWESGKIELPDDIYIPHVAYSDIQIAQMIAGHEVRGKILFFEGQNTGTILNADFAEVLEDIS